MLSNHKASDYQAWNVSTNQMIAKSATLRGVIDDWRASQQSTAINFAFIVIANYDLGQSLGVSPRLYSEEFNKKTILKPSAQIPVHLAYEGTLDENHNVAAEIFCEQELFRSAGYTDYDVFNMGMDRNEWIELQAKKEGISLDDFYRKIFQNRESEEEQGLIDKPQDIEQLTNNEDGREKIVALIVQRRGQSEFRQRLIEAYEGKCSITGCDAVEALEAAHIFPYRGTHTNYVNNGLLLRADIHTLFDLGLIAIDTSDMSIILAETLKSTSYAKYQNNPLFLPSREADWPNKTLLDHHRKSSSVA